MTLLSDFDQSNMKRGYNGKCRNCSRVGFEGSGGQYQDGLCVNSDADKTLAQWGSRQVSKCYITVVENLSKIWYVTSEYLIF